jgi:serine/threonine protein phosphatase PrpC
MEKFNFGHGIAIFFTCFVSLTLFQVIKSVSIDHTLVKDDYYIDDAQLEMIMTKKINQKELKDFSFEYKSEANKLVLSFPVSKMPSGTIKLYCPFNARLDQSHPIKVDADNILILSTDGLTNGKWKVLLDWKDGTKSYYFEKEFIVI